jgi:hypothetical protein
VADVQAARFPALLVVAPVEAGSPRAMRVTGRASPPVGPPVYLVRHALLI